MQRFQPIAIKNLGRSSRLGIVGNFILAYGKRRGTRPILTPVRRSAPFGDPSFNSCFKNSLSIIQLRIRFFFSTGRKQSWTFSLNFYLSDNDALEIPKLFQSNNQEIFTEFPLTNNDTYFGFPSSEFKLLKTEFC